jgi:hypothetical protein
MSPDNWKTIEINTITHGGHLLLFYQQGLSEDRLGELQIAVLYLYLCSWLQNGNGLFTKLLYF